ncbi:MAG: diguanylate cyclase domain-containing protein [Solirubrobacterales bacterium]
MSPTGDSFNGPPSAEPPAPQIALEKSNRDSPGGQAALNRRLAPDPDFRNRSITGGVLWGAAALLGAIQQYGPDGTAMPATIYYAILAVAIAMSLGCVLIGPRLSPRAFVVGEEAVIASGWAVTAALVAATGGASSPDIGIYANTMFYCAYFMSPRRALRQVITGTLFMWAPLVYDFSQVGSGGFVPRATVMTAVLWAMALLIARNRRATEAAEMRARRLALTDPLTGVANLRTFEDELQRALAAARDAGEELGVAFVDVNGLKVANTVFGHAGGDRLICGTAEALGMASSVADQVARVGGDEFAVLRPGAGESAMRSFEGTFALALTGVEPPEGAPPIELSASIGTAVYPADGETLDALMAVADSRMYDSKSSLPQRLPTPETSGGRSLSDAPHEESSRFRSFMSGSAPAAALAWLLGAGLILISVGFGGGDPHTQAAFLLAIVCIVAAGYLGLAPEEHRRAAERISNTLAVAIALPVIYATGGVTTPGLPLVYLVVAHAAYALTPRAAAVRTGAVLAMIATPLFFGVSAEQFMGVMTIIGEVLVIAALLLYNRHRTSAAEARAIELSRIDALTKLANRRVFERTLAERAEALFEDEDVPDAPGGLILLDVDDFKAINTAGGHQSGDEVLRMIASVLDGAIGREATVCRIGGDEFAAIFTAGDGPEIMRAAAKARAAIGSVDWNVLCEPNVTVSIGYATWDQVASWKDLVVAADLALQISKSSGKDTVSTAPENAMPRIGLARASRVA